MPRYWVKVEGVSDFLEPNLGGQVLHFMDKPAEMANVIWVKLQVTVAPTLDPQGVVRFSSSLPKSISV